MIVGLGGAKEAGKNTASRALSALGFKELSFAHPLKRACAFTFNLNYEIFDSHQHKDWELKEPVRVTASKLTALCGYLKAYHEFTEIQMRDMMDACKGVELFTPRQVLQFVATELIRNCVDEEFWCKAMATEAAKHENVVITDVRFPNERAMIRSLGGKLVLIKRPHQTHADGHISEMRLGTEEDYDVTIMNDGHPVGLQQELHNWYLKQSGAVIGQETRAQ